MKRINKDSIIGISDKIKMAYYYLALAMHKQLLQHSVCEKGGKSAFMKPGVQ